MKEFIQKLKDNWVAWFFITLIALGGGPVRAAEVDYSELTQSCLAIVASDDLFDSMQDNASEYLQVYLLDTDETGESLLAAQIGVHPEQLEETA